MFKYPVFLIILVFLSCTKEDMIFEIGDKYTDVNTNICYVDTFRIHSYTVRMDSLETSGLTSPSIIVGRYVDPVFGTLSSKSFFRVSRPSSYTLPHDAIYDSLQLILIHDDYFTGDTNASYTIKAHRLTETLQSIENKTLYNTSHFDYNPAVFGSTTFRPRPATDDTITLRLDDLFGNELFNLLQDKSFKNSDNNTFLLYFKGFALDYDENNKAVLGYRVTSDSIPVMRLYYHYFDYQNISKYIDFPVSVSSSPEGYINPDLQFNQISLPGPPFDTLVQTNMLPAKYTGNSTYVQGGTGILTRLEIPYLRYLGDNYENMKILSAELVLKPVRHSYDIFDLPQKISLLQTDRFNRLGSYVYGSDGSVLVARLKIDELFHEETSYTFDVTAYVKAIISLQSDQIPSLFVTLSPEDLNKTLDRLVLSSQSQGNQNVTLKVHFMFYE